MMGRSFSPSLLLVLVACGAIPLGGCGDGRPKRVPVSGRVLIDGQPLTRGTVRFIPSNNRASSGQVDREGHFVLSCFAQGDGAVVGQHDVTVTASESLNDTQIRWNAPKKYADPFTSGLTQAVDGPTDSVVINLTWDGGKPFVEGGSPRRKAEGDGDPPRLRGKSSAQ